MPVDDATMPDGDWPTGAVTFLFSDIENSAPLWDRHEASMRPALAVHDRLLHTAVTSHSGVVVKTTGDGVLAAFSSPSAALSAAVDAQRALRDAAWPSIAPDTIRVRMGLHTGEAELRGGDYYGTAVNRAARLTSLAHGGQILVSGTTTRLVEGALPGEIDLLDLGEHQLKGMARPAHVYQALAAGLPRDFPPLRAAEAARNNLPQPLTSFVGREQELADIERLMKETRLLTLTGPGGMGKTQLAIEWARRKAQAGVAERARYADGLYFVDLAPVANLDQVAPAVADVLAFPLQGERRAPEQQLLDYLQKKRLLLVLDNLEHIIDASDLINEILYTAPGVQILVTSRKRLNLKAEQVYTIAGLAYPPADYGTAPHLEDLESYAAVQLFLRSARRVRPGFQLEPADRQALVRICRTTAGMPLAIELAAAWIALLPLDTLAEEIERRLDLLETDMRDLPARHRSIRATVDTTLRYLSPLEQRIFMLLSIFRGGFTWQAASAVLAPEDGELALRRTLAKLASSSLIVYDDLAERFAMHELLRQYAVEQLATGDRAQEVTRAREKYALYYSRLLQECELGLRSAQYTASLRVIEADLQNMLVAWDWLIDNERCPELAAAMDSLGFFYEIQGYLPTGQRNFSAVAARWRERLAGFSQADADVEAQDRRFLAKALAWQSVFELDRQKAESLLLQSLVLLDDPAIDERESIAERAFAYYRLGKSLYDSQMPRAIVYLNEGLVLYQSLGDLWGIAYCLLWLGSTNLFVNMATSRRYLLQAVEAFEKTGDVRGLSEALYWLASVAGYQGEDAMMEEARERFLVLVGGQEQAQVLERSLGINATAHDVKGNYAQAAGYREMLVALVEDLGRDSSMEKIYLATMYLHGGETERGRALLEQGRRKFEQAAVANDHQLAFCLHVLSMLALAEGEFEMAQYYLEERAIPIYRHNEDDVDLAGAYAFSAIAFTGLGELDAAWSRVVAGLTLALDHRGFYALGESLLAVALLWAHSGRLQQARELYELVRRRPKFGKSALYEGMAGQKIRELTGFIAPDALQALVTRAAAGDIWQEAAALHTQLAPAGVDVAAARENVAIF